MSAAHDSRLAVYQQLRKSAQKALRNERPDHTLTATALVHEAFIKLDGQSFANRQVFYAAACTSMRQILIDHARARLALKRDGGKRIDLDRIGDALMLATHDRCEEILILDEALSRLEQRDPQAAEIVRLRFYAGLDIAETAEVLGTSPATVKRDWKFARAALYLLLSVESRPECNPDNS